MKQYSSQLTNATNNGVAIAMLYQATKLSHEQLKTKSLVGIHSTGYSGNPCNMHLDIIANTIKKSIDSSDIMHGMRYNTIGISDGQTMGTPGMRYSLPSREHIADSVSTMIDAHCYDSNISVVGCDKNLPGALIGMIKVNRPGMIIYGGSIKPGCHKSKDVDIVTAFQSYGEFVSNKITSEDRNELLTKCCPTPGGCAGMYTANTMAMSFEALGVMPPNYSSNMAIDYLNNTNLLFSDIKQYMEILLLNNIKIKDIVTKESIINALKVVYMMGGSTNAILHYLAIACYANIKLSLDIIDYSCSNLPVIANMKPLGKYVMNDINKIGGTKVILKFMLENGFLNGNCITITGNTLKENLNDITIYNIETDVFNPKQPINFNAHIQIFYGNLAPEGCIAKYLHKDIPKCGFIIGYAKLYERESDFINDIRNNNIKHDDVILIRGMGPKGAPGMPEMLESTSALLGAKLNNVLLTDGRFSGGSSGVIFSHLSPEAYIGGPISNLVNGDKIKIDFNNKTINVIDYCGSGCIECCENKYYNNDTTLPSFLQNYRNCVSSASLGCILYTNEVDILNNIKQIKKKYNSHYSLVI